MERARPPRSGIPTFVGSNEGRVHTQWQEKGSEEIYHSPGRVDNVTYQSPNRKDKLSHFSPRPQRNGHHVVSGHVDTCESGNARSQLHSEHQNHPRSNRSLSDEGGPVSYVNSCGHCHTPKHRTPTRRPHVTYAHTKRSDLCRSSQREFLERNVIGCESPQDCLPSTQPLTVSEKHTGEKDTRENEAYRLEHHTAGTTLLQDGRCYSSGHHNFNSGVSLEMSLFESSACPESSSEVSALPTSDGNTAISAHISERPVTTNDCNSSNLPNSDDNGDVVMDTHSNTPVASIVDADYPIRGTISPLTSKVAVKRSLGPVDEVSFVFGRPASPTNDQAIRCSSPQVFSNPGIAKCMSPSPGRYIAGHYNSRPLSPSSDILPRRKGTFGAYPDRRVLSPPPLLGVGAAAEPRIHHQGGICCEHCNGCLVELKRQALRLMFPDNGAGGHLAQSIRVDNIIEHLTLPDGYERWYSRTGQCGLCETPLGQLKQEAVAMIQSIQLAQTTAMPTNLPALVGSCGHLPQLRNRYSRKLPPSYASSSPMSSSPLTPSLPLAAQAQAYLEQNVRAYINPQKHAQMLAGRVPSSGLHLTQQDTHYDTPGSPVSISDISRTSSTSRSSVNHHNQHYQLHHQWPGYAHLVSTIPSPGSHHVPFRGVTSTSPNSSPLSPPPVPSAAVSFFARAAQKLGKKKKRHHSQDQEPQPSYPTNFAEVIRLTPPPAPPCLLRTVGRLQNPGMGKVKVMLKICNPSGSQTEQGSSFLSSDPRKKQVTVFDPSASGYVTSASRRTSTAAPKMFAFDSVVTPDDSLTELCASSLAEIVQAVVAGADGCVFTYGYSKLGKTYTMIGSDQSPSTLGVMPCAIAWLFKLINEQKDKTGARFSVRVSAVQVTGKEEILQDLLSDIAQAGAEATGAGTAPSVYLREDPICGTQIENQSELRAPTADKAAFYLDAALAARSAVDDDESKSSHLLFTLNVYQYRIEKSNTKAGLPGVAGGRSRLHLIDLGTSSKSKDPNNVSLSLSALGNVVMALLNGQRHVPHRDSKIAQLLRDSLSNLSCRTCMIAHVSSAVPHYNESLQVIQLAARIHRMKRRRTKFSSTSSEDSSTDGDAKFRRPYRGLRMGTLREDVLYSSSHSDPDYTSSSEQSCDTVIYIGANGQSLSDRELTDNEGPPRHVPRTNPRLPRRPSGSRSSGDDSDSGRSMHSVRSWESRLPVRSLMSSPPLMAANKLGQVPSVPGSPNPGVVKMGHIVGLYTKVAGSLDGRVVANDGSLSSGPWQEKTGKMHCHASQSKMAKAIHEKQQPLDGELWIDGPGTSVYPEPTSSEMWVDGPQAFVVQQQPQSVISSPSLRDAQHHHYHHHHHSDSSSRRAATKKVDAEEQWVDGPKEMLAGSGPAQPMHTSIKVENTSRSSYQTKTCMPNKVNEKVLKQTLVKHMDSRCKPETVSENSDSSLAIEITESGTANIHSSEDLSNSKHKSDCSNPATSDIKQVDASSSPMVSTKKPKLSESPKKTHSYTQSPKQSPSPSPSMSRKCNKIEASHCTRLQKSQLPGSASPTHRVVQWIKSVSSDGEFTEAGKEPTKTDSVAHQPVQSNISMTDAETNTEHDSDFERLAEENGIISDNDDELETLSSMREVDCETFSSNDRKCNIILDTSLDSSFYASVVNRESIYEMEIEEQLELMKTKDGSRLAAEVDNETFSSVSCSNKDPDELDRDHSGCEMESLLVQHTKVLTESKQTAQLARHLGRGQHTRNISPASCDLDDEHLELSQPLLSRKPDGASNPNLHKIFSEEDSVGKSPFISLPGSSVKAMFVSASHNDSGIDFPTTSSKSYVADLDDEDSFCDNDMQSLCGKGECNRDCISPKLGANNKPPLPTKSSPTLKQIGLPKLNTNSQSSTNSSPTRSVYCMAKPTRPGKDSQTNQQKTPPNGKMSGVPLSSPTIRSKFARGDKASCSSSGTSHSPQSSVTSSPLISITSKSSSSSPVQKASSKSQNGSASKLPSLCSSKTSSPSTKDCSKTRKKEKDFKGVSSSHASLLSDLVLKGKGNDSDSGNDSGIVAHEKRLLSPYATVTKPRTPSHSSSGHGSDNSTISTEVHPGNSRPCTKTETLHGGTSSGYESMLRDSEATGSSSGHDDSGSETSSQNKKGSKRKGTRRSRSAPAHSPESSPVSSQPSQAGSRSVGPTHRNWIDTRHLHKVKDEPLELKKYDPDEVERLGRRRTEDEIKASSDAKQKNSSSKMEEVSKETSESKDTIVIERNGWSFDCKFLMCFSCKSRQRGTDV